MVFRKKLFALLIETLISSTFTFESFKEIHLQHICMYTAKTMHNQEQAEEGIELYISVKKRVHIYSNKKEQYSY